MVAAACLADDDPTSARTMVRAAIAQWPQTGFSVQHWHAMLYEANIDLYAGEGALGYERFAQGWGAVKKSLLLHGVGVRVPSLFLRAGLAIASIAGDPAVAAKRIAEARGYASELEKEADPWVAVLVALARATADNAAGDRQSAVAGLRVALECAAVTSTRVYLAPARHRLGLLLGGDEGRRLVQEAETELIAQGIRNPERWIRIHLPGSWGP
jgi:hypothetical protein